MARKLLFLVLITFIAACFGSFYLPADRVPINVVSADPCGAGAASAAQVAREREWLQWDNQLGGLYINSGAWTLTQPLVIPRDSSLTVNAGVTLSFGPNAYLLACSPVHFLGSSESPVVLQAATDGGSWPGIYVQGRPTVADSLLDRVLDNSPYTLPVTAGTRRIRGSQQQSVWRHVRIESIDATEESANRSGAGVSFYRANVNMHEVDIDNVESAAALNIVHASFVLDRFRLQGASDDGLVAEFSTGTILNSSFNRIDDDAIDSKTTNILAVGLDFGQIGDRGISAGEGSQLFISQSRMADLGVGIAAKDASKVVADNVDMAGVKQYGLLAYNDTRGFGGATITAFAVAVDVSDKSALSQVGNVIEFNGARVAEVSFDADQY